MMDQTTLPARSGGATYAISNTGPLISAFQSNSFVLLTHLFVAIHLTPTCFAELKKHGWDEELQSASSKLVVIKLTAGEKKRALAIARQIAEHPDSHDPIAANHLGEAEAIVLASRREYRNDLILLDESVARAIAKAEKLRVSGFPGALLLAVQLGLISAEDLQTRLESCRAQGTHYSAAFIDQVYEMAKRGKK